MYMPNKNNRTVFIDNVHKVKNLFPKRCTVEVDNMLPKFVIIDRIT